MATKKPIEIHLTHLDVAKAKKVFTQKAASVDFIHAENVVQYLTPKERAHFFNECHRVLKKGAKLQTSVPHWCASVAFGDLAVQFPPVVESFFFHLNAGWREANKPVFKELTCDFDTTWGYGMHPAIVPRNQEYQQNAIQFWKEAAQSLVATSIKR